MSEAVNKALEQPASCAWLFEACVLLIVLLDHHRVPISMSAPVHTNVTDCTDEI